MGFFPFIKSFVMGGKRQPVKPVEQLKEAEPELGYGCSHCEFSAKTPAALKAHNTRKHS